MGRTKGKRQHVVFWPDGPTRNARSWGAVSGTATRWRQATQAAPGSAAQCWKLRVLVMPGSPWLALHGAAGHSIRLSETSEAFCSSARIPASGCLAWHRWYSSVPGAVRRSQLRVSTQTFLVLLGRSGQGGPQARPPTEALGTRPPEVVLLLLRVTGVASWKMDVFVELSSACQVGHWAMDWMRWRLAIQRTLPFTLRC